MAVAAQDGLTGRSLGRTGSNDMSQSAGSWQTRPVGSEDQIRQAGVSGALGISFGPQPSIFEVGWRR